MINIRNGRNGLWFAVLIRNVLKLDSSRNAKGVKNVDEINGNNILFQTFRNALFFPKKR